MNNKILNLIIGMFVATFLVHTLSATEPEAADPCYYLSIAPKSAIVDGYYVAVMNYNTAGHVLANKPLCYFVWTTGIKDVAWVSVPTSIEYAYDVNLFDTNGNSVPKTWLGKSVGTKFSDFKIGKGYFESKAKPQPIGALTTNNPPLGGIVIFSPSDYFNIKKPGDYTLKIRFQIVAPVIEPGTTNEIFKVIRFPAMDFPITQPEKKN